jgi:hypothetical protein
MQMKVPWGTSLTHLMPQPLLCVLKTCSLMDIGFWTTRFKHVDEHRHRELHS